MGAGEALKPQVAHSVVRTALAAPFGRRAHTDLLACAVGLVSGVAVAVVVWASLVPGTAESVARALVILPLLAVVLVATGAARGLGAASRRLAARLLGTRVAEPPPIPRGGRRLDRMRARLGDGVSWRALAYLLAKLPLVMLQTYALLYWAGVANLTYPFWWGLFRNHAPGIRLRPVWFLTPFGVFRVATLPGTFVVAVAGVAMLLAAPWVTRAVTSLDGWLVRALLAPGRLAERVSSLERTRAQAVEDAAARLRRIERDLHDGAQVQLATLAMKLGQAREKLQHGAEVPYDPDGALALVEAAHRHAKEALVELRDIARGIHPPALDVGLDPALATLVARSAVPATLAIDVPVRPSQAIETITYFSAAELIANVAKHSRARHATVEVAAHNGMLRLRVSDDGIGGAEPDAGSGLSGLADRVRAVDGHLQVSSPPGGPTVVTVELPLRA